MQVPVWFPGGQLHSLVQGLEAAGHVNRDLDVVSKPVPRCRITAAGMIPRYEETRTYWIPLQRAVNVA